MIPFFFLYMQFLGRISMSLYLVHEPVIFYINLCVYGPYLGPVPPEAWRRKGIGHSDKFNYLCDVI